MSNLPRVERLSPEALEDLVVAIIEKKVTFAKYLGGMRDILTTFLPLLDIKTEVENTTDVADVYQFNDKAFGTNIFGNLMFNDMHYLHVDDYQAIGQKLREMMTAKDPSIPAKDLELFEALQQIQEIIEEKAQTQKAIEEADASPEWDL